MKRNINKLLYIFALTLILCVSSCYKDDVQDLYSRQYLVNKDLKELDDLADKINQQFKDLRVLITQIQNKNVVTKTEEHIVDGKAVGIYLYFGDTRVYVPYGKDGKNGLDGTNAPIFSIGDDGYWYINGVKTDKKAIGNDGCTPQIGVAQDPDNTSDSRVYWQVTWCDGKKEFIKHEGKKVPAKGVDGLPGVVSAIKSIKVVNNSVIITPTKEGAPDIVIPIVPDVMFEIFPSKAEGQQGQDKSSSYDLANNVLTFKDAEEVIVIPFVKSDYLGNLAADLPKGWSIKVNYQDKKISLTAPDLSDMPQSNHNFSMLLSARKADGQTWSREILVNLDKKMYINYFFTANPKSPTGRPTSVANKMNFDGITKDYMHFCVYAIQDEQTGHLKDNVRVRWEDVEAIRKYVREAPSRTFEKPEKYINVGITQVDFFFQTDILGVQVAAKTPSGDWDSNKLDYYRLVYNIDASEKGEKDTNVQLVKPLNVNNYISYSVRTAGNRSDVHTIRVQRATAEIRFFIRDIKGLLGLNTPSVSGTPPTDPAQVAEEFDLSRLSFRYPTAYAVYTDEGYTIFKDNVDGTEERPGTVAKVNGTDPCVKYDKANDLITGAFGVLPNGRSRLNKLMLIYKKADGTTIKKVFSQDGFNHSPIGMGWTATFCYKYDYKKGQNSEDNMAAYSDNIYTYTNTMSISTPDESNKNFWWD